MRDFWVDWKVLYSRLSLTAIFLSVWEQGGIYTRAGTCEGAEPETRHLKTRGVQFEGNLLQLVGGNMAMHPKGQVSFV